MPNSTVLVVDDHDMTREILAASLQDSGYVVFEARNGVEALGFVHTAVLSAIVTDLHMPGLEGWGLLRALREDPATQDIPAIVLTADPRPQARAAAEAAGCARYLLKPLVPQQVVEAVRELTSSGAP